MLAAWTASPARFREDANAEEDLVRGGYRDRVVVELAQNAADAASTAGVPGRLRLVLANGVLTALNTGAPLDAAGVEALATLRASAKRAAGTVGRFGVGFAAVLAVTDRPAVHSRDGGVRFDAARVRAQAASRPSLAAELARRDGAVPVLRLPWPAEALAELPDGGDSGDGGGGASGAAAYTTAVVLPLRDEAAQDLVRRLLGEVDEALLLTLPALEQIEVEVDGAVREVRVQPDRWAVVRRTGRLPAALLHDRPVEERAVDHWSVLVAIPLRDGRPAPPPSPAVLRAPTPTDEPLSVPAVVAASLPLEPSRRHVAPGPLRDHVLAAAAAACVEALTLLPADPAVLGLVPVGLAAGACDAVLREHLRAGLRDAAFLPAVGRSARQRPRDALALDVGEDNLVDVLGDVLAGLLPRGWHGRAAVAPLTALGVRRLGPADLVDALAGLARPPLWWRDVYEALAAAAPDVDALGALPVPLQDGRLVTGARGLLLPTPDAAALPDLTPLGLRSVHPQAVHPLLLRLGARPATPEQLLADPQVRAAVETSYDAEEPQPVAQAVLALVAAAGSTVEQLPWLAELALPGADGEDYPAGELLLPGGQLAGLVEPDAPFGVVDPALVERVGPQVLRAVGVLDGFAVLRDTDVTADPDLASHDLDGQEQWYAGLSGDPLPPVLPELVAVRDLELVRADAWPAALPLLAATPLRDAVVGLQPVRHADGRVSTVPSYTAWWLARHRVIGGRRPLGLRVPGGDPALAGLFDSAPDLGLDPTFLRALGCRFSLEEVLASPAGALDALWRLADPARTVPRSVVRRVYAGLVAAFAGVESLDAYAWPARLRAVTADGALEVVDAVDVLAVDRPDLLPLLGGYAHLPVPARLAVEVADLVEVPLASELSAYDVVSAATRVVAWQDLPGIALACERVGVDVPSGEVAIHEGLRARDVAGTPVAVPWISAGPDDAAVDAAGGSAALGRALAWRCGRWSGRAAAGEALGGAAGAALLAAEDDLGG